MRGEHPHQARKARPQRGSSPHARGARARLIDTGARAGIIPACAGSTRKAGDGWCIRQDHPRMRGEHISAPPSST